MLFQLIYRPNALPLQFPFFIEDFLRFKQRFGKVRDAHLTLLLIVNGKEDAINN
jgi:hypothetical protein